MSDLWDRQVEFTNKVVLKKDKNIDDFTSVDRVKWTKEYLLNLQSEMTEVLEEMSWRYHKKEIFDVFELTNLYIELIDIQKYLWGLMRIWDMSESKFREIFEMKSYVVEKLWDQDFELEGKETQEACIIDIDGVLNYYPQCFLDWGLEQGVNLGEKPELKLEFKRLYRSSGAKRFIPINYESVTTLRELKKRYVIVLLTDRPHSQIKRIVFDTYKWLDDNNIYYDFLFWSFGHSKASILRRVPNIKFIIDDSEKTCREFSDIGIKAYWFNGDCSYDNIVSIRSLKEIE